MVLFNCSHVRIHGLTLDADPRGTIEGTVLAIDHHANALQLNLSAGSTFRPMSNMTSANAGRILPYKSDGRFITPLYAFQANGGVYIANSSMEVAADGSFWVTMQNRQLLDMTSTAAWRLAYGSSGMLEVGDGVAILWTGGDSIRLDMSEAISVIGMRSHGTKMGPAEWGGEGGHLWQSSYFGPRPGTNQLTGGDGFMNCALRKGSTFDRLEICTTTDDLFNFHSYWGFVIGVHPPSTVQLTQSYFNQ